MLILATAGAGLRTKPSLSVVIPAYNERERLPTTLRSSLAYLRQEGADRHRRAEVLGHVCVLGDGVAVHGHVGPLGHGGELFVVDHPAGS